MVHWDAKTFTRKGCLPLIGIAEEAQCDTLFFRAVDSKDPEPLEIIEIGKSVYTIQITVIRAVLTSNTLQLVCREKSYL